ncbi:MAG: helix-turn-helix domain-containing protein [Candidatus Binatia bacterium]
MTDALDTNTTESPSAPPRALVVAVDAGKRRQLAEMLSAQGAHVREAESVPRVWETLGEEPFDVVVPVDDVLHGPGKQLIKELKAFDDATVVVAVVDSPECSQRALAAGAYDVFPSPVDGARFGVVLRHIEETLRLRGRCAVLDRMMNGGAHLGALLTRDPHMIQVVDSIRRLARYRMPVLVVGEPGTEHEEVARALHDLGRPNGTFAVCRASALTTAELRQQRTAAAGGTLYIDDVNALAADVAAALTAMLEESTTVAGGPPPRIVVGYRQGTLAPLAPGDPRTDLRRQLEGAVLTLPPLRERRGDAVLVARELAAGIGRDRGRALALARPVEDALLAYPWPGNLDELKTVVVTAATAANGPAIEAHDLPAALAGYASGPGQPAGTRLLRDLESQHLRQVLEETRGNKSRAARILGLSRWALQRKLRKHGIAYGEDAAEQGSAEHGSEEDE